MSDGNKCPRTFGPAVKRGPESMSTFCFGPIMVFAGLSHTPGDRLWGHTEPSRLTRTRHVISLHYLEKPSGQRIWGIYLWRLCLYWGFRP